MTYRGNRVWIREAGGSRWILERAAGEASLTARTVAESDPG